MSQMLAENVSFHMKYCLLSWDESLQFQLKFEALVRLLRLIVWPQEVSEVTEVKVRKILDENPKIANF